MLDRKAFRTANNHEEANLAALFLARKKNLLTILCAPDRRVLSEKVPKLLGGIFVDKFKLKKRITTQDEGRFFDA